VCGIQAAQHPAKIQRDTAENGDWPRFWWRVPRNAEID